MTVQRCVVDVQGCLCGNHTTGDCDKVVQREDGPGVAGHGDRVARHNLIIVRQSVVVQVILLQEPGSEMK